jgi:hypothetical protein
VPAGALNSSLPCCGGTLLSSAPIMTITGVRIYNTPHTSICHQLYNQNKQRLSESERQIYLQTSSKQNPTKLNMSSGRFNYRATEMCALITTALCSKSHITMTLTYLVNISNRRLVVEAGIDSTIRHIAEVKRRPSLHITPTHTTLTLSAQFTA